MGITTRSYLGHTIRDFWPDNTDNKFYIPENDLSLDDLVSQAKDYFRDRYNPEQIRISFDNIHVRCLDYDVHDTSDWQEFFIITLNKN